MGGSWQLLLATVIKVFDNRKDWTRSPHDLTPHHPSTSLS
jgi:hypothetical protein